MRDFINKNKFYIWIFIIILFLILWRIYYSLLVYNYTFSSGDATMYVLRALYFQQWFFENWLNMIKSSITNQLFYTPFFVPYILWLFSLFLWIDLYHVTFIITPIITIIWIVFLYYFLYKKHWYLLSFLTTLLIAVNSYISFYSTEPLKAPYIVSFFIISIYFLLKWWNKRLFISLFFLWLTIFVHLTGIFFIVWYMLVYLIINRNNLKQYFNPIFLLWLIYILFLISTYKCLNNFFGFDLHAKLGFYKSLWFAQWEIDAFFSNLKTWWKYFGFFSFVSWIKRQIWEFMFYLSLIWVQISLFRKKYRNIFLFVVVAIVFVWFSVKRVASSHWSRYPFYVNWLFIYYFIIFVIFVYNKIKYKTIKNIFIVLIIIISFLNTWFFKHYVAGYRHQYKANKEIWIYIGKNVHIDENNKMLIMWWPSTIYWILKYIWINKKEYLIEYWWLSKENLNLISEDFLKKNKIKYFLYEKTWRDYLYSYDILQKKFRDHIKKVYEIKDWKKRKVILYKITYGN